MTVVTREMERTLAVRVMLDETAVSLAETQIQMRLDQIQRLFPNNPVSFFCDMGQASVGFVNPMQFGDDDDPLNVQYIFDQTDVNTIAQHPSVSLKRLATLAQEIFELTNWCWDQFRIWPSALTAKAA